MEQNLVGRSVFGYRITSVIGSGASGTVYQAVKSNALGEYVRAIKHISFPSLKQYSSVLNSMGGDEAKTNEYFARSLNTIASEVKLLNALSESGSSHIIRYYESYLETEGNPLRYHIFILMEHATPLSEFVRSGSFKVRNVVDMGLQILEGIGTCHKRGVIHRDIKEDNIFVGSDGLFKIGDFGVSKSTQGGARAESLKGTPNYLAPEVYLGEKSYSKTVDLYSLGIVLYRLLNHERNPFLPAYPNSYSAEDEDRAFELRIKGNPVPLPAFGGPEIGKVIATAISSEQTRFQDAEGFARALRNAAAATRGEVLDHDLGLSLSDAHRSYRSASVSAMSSKSAVGIYPSQSSIQGVTHGNKVSAPSGSQPKKERGVWGTAMVVGAVGAVVAVVGLAATLVVTLLS